MSNPSLHVESLLKAHTDGDPRAFPRLLDGVKNDLWGYLVNQVQMRQDAEDLYQEISLKAYKNLKRLRDPTKFRSWLFSIAVNSVRSFFRRKPMLSLETLGGEEAGSAREITQDKRDMVRDLELEEELYRLRHCIQDLPEREREILLLEVMAELPQKEIADRLGLNLNTVKTIIRRSKIKLARMMVEAGYEC